MSTAKVQEPWDDDPEPVNELAVAYARRTTSTGPLTRMQMQRRYGKYTTATPAKKR